MLINSNLNLDCGKGVPFTITPENVAELVKRPDAIAHVIAIGLKNILQDSHASIKYDDFKTEEECQAAKRERAGKKLLALLAGDVRTARAGSSNRVDSFTTFARRLVLSMLSKEKKKVLAESADKGVAYLDAVYEKNAEKLKPQVDAMITEAAEKARKAAELADGLDLDI
jgi:hypothetical protein